MDEISITVVISDRNYRLTIKKEEEEIIRKVARNINDKLKSYAEQYAFKDKQDLFAMVAMELGTQYESSRLYRDGFETEIRHKLTRMVALIDKGI
jgi:cell division protein ZapA